MPRLALVFFLLCLAPPAWATQCPEHYAGGQAPIIVNVKLRPRTQELCFRAFVVVHSGLSRTPLWSAEHLVRANVLAAEELIRKNSFHVEARLPPQDRSMLADFARSGYDKGHLSPNGDMPEPVSQGESFSLANMVAQVHANNAGIWAGIESAVRQLAIREGEVYVVTGPAFIGDEIASLKGRVLIPTHLWKVVYSPKREQAGAYLVTNDEARTYSSLSVTDLGKMIGIAPLPGVPQRVRDAGMDLPVPSSEGGAHVGKKRKRGGTISEGDEYSLSDLARRSIEAMLKRLTK